MVSGVRALADRGGGVLEEFVEVLVYSAQALRLQVSTEDVDDRDHRRLQLCGTDEPGGVPAVLEVQEPAPRPSPAILAAQACCR